MKVWSGPAKFYNTIKYLLLFGVSSHKSTFIKSSTIEGFFRKLQLPYLSLSATYHNINFYKVYLVNSLYYSLKNKNETKTVIKISIQTLFQTNGLTTCL